MTASELRLGNLILFRGNLICLDTNYELFKSLVDISRNDKRYKPIPLTEEWLLKFGFTICENYFWYEKKIPTLGIVVSCNLHGRFSIDHKYDVVTIRDCCYNVHQLQNLYFALTGEELTFKSE